MIAPFDLNLRHLRALSAIVARGSMSAAAEVVSLSQPALTQGLAKLEAQLGAALFDRRADGMLPTEAGRALASRAEAAFAHLAGAVRGSGRGFARPDRLMTATQLRLPMPEALSAPGWRPACPNPRSTVPCATSSRCAALCWSNGAGGESD
jgi:DNA-binding transcriptional LysR family regulator